MKRIILAALLFSGSASAAEPRRVVSLSPCIDNILVSIADREQIGALSHYSRDPSASTISDIARTYPITYESAEEVILFVPDLVLTSRHSALATRNALSRMGIQTELFDVPQTVKESLAEVRRVADLIGHPDRGEELVSRIEAAIAAAAPPPGQQPVSALIFQRNGFSSGKGTLVDEMLNRTGFVNVSARYGITYWGYVPLERLVADPPQVLLAGEIEAGMPTWADRMLRHPALASVASRMKRITFPDPLLTCGGPVILKTAAILAAARRSVTGETP